MDIFDICQIFLKTKAFFSHSPMSDGYFDHSAFKQGLTFFFMIWNISSLNKFTNTFSRKKSVFLNTLFTALFLS